MGFKISIVHILKTGFSLSLENYTLSSNKQK